MRKRIAALVAIIIIYAATFWGSVMAQQPFTIVGNGQTCEGTFICSPLLTPPVATMPTTIDAYNIIGTNRAVNVWCNLGAQVVVLEQRADRVMVGCAGGSPTPAPTMTATATAVVPPTATATLVFTPTATSVPTVAPTATPTATGVLTVTTLNLQVASGNDDAHEAETNYGFTVTDPNLLIQAAANNYDRWWAGIRFSGITIPQGATITSASIQAYKMSSNDILATIYAEDVDNADDFSTTADVSGRTPTTASVSWTDSSGSVNAWVTSPDITAVIQEIVDRGSWSSGNALVLLLAGRANGSNVSGFIRSYNGDSVFAAKLDIEYSAGGGDVSVSVSDSGTLTDAPTLSVVSNEEPALSVHIGKRALTVEIN